MLSGFRMLTSSDARDTSTAQQEQLGAVAFAPDGRRYRYAKAGATDLVAGNAQIAAAHVANHVNLTTTAAAAGATQVTVTLGATAATANQYAEGYLVVNATGASTGAGISYKIKGHPAAASSGSLTVDLVEPIVVALTSSSKTSLIKNPHKDIVISASAVTANVVGVPNVVVAASSFGWVQTQGYCSVLSDGIIGKGSGAIISDAVNGAVEVEVAGTVTQRVGIATEATVDTEFRNINLLID